MQLGVAVRVRCSCSNSVGILQCSTLTATPNCSSHSGTLLHETFEAAQGIWMCRLLIIILQVTTINNKILKPFISSYLGP